MINLKASYDRAPFLDWLEEFLSEDLDILTKEKDVPITSQFKRIDSAKILAEVPSLELSVFEISHSSFFDPRVEITKEIFRIMTETFKHRAIIAIKNPSSSSWRLSLMTIDLDIDTKGHVKQKSSNPRRYSYVLGPNAKIATPTQFLIKNGRVKDFDDLKSRFSVEVVNNEFYREIAKLYDQLVGADGKPGALKYPGSEDQKHEFAVRLIGRTIFGWFLREKKSNTGKPLIPRELLSSNAAQKDNYYNEILAPLFFQVLNKQIVERTKKFRSNPYDSIPYLNGGLFNPDSIDQYKFDKTLELSVPGLVDVPDVWLRNFFDLLEAYNFTIDENTSYDIDLSIDPEMLGRIFENLLARINPETGETVRKLTGSFYTPREIVDYMVDRSLIEYLSTRTDIENEKINALVSYDLSDDKEHALDESDKKQILSALDSLKTLDPACGSGAFPIGVLQKIVFMLQQIDPNCMHWLDMQLNSASPELKHHLLQQYEDKNFDYLRKLGVIRKSIYGVDIQPIATEISRLRCFLTLIVDQSVDDQSENRGIMPLPNLEFKFISANSLIKLNDSAKLALGDEKLKGLEDELFEIRTNKFFQANSSDEKKEMREKDEQLSRKILLATAGLSGSDKNKVEKWKKDLNEAKNKLESLDPQFLESTQESLFGENGSTQIRLLSQDETNLKNNIAFLQKKIRVELKKSNSADFASKLQMITSWDPYSTSTSASFFDSEWMFGVNSGFDIVIGNPPYVDAEQMVKMDDGLRDVYANIYSTAKGNWDLYIPFVEMGYEKLGHNSVLTYITPNKWLAIGYGKMLRKYTINSLSLFTDLSEVDVFDAGNNPIIFSLKKDNSNDYLALDRMSKNHNIYSSLHVERSIVDENNFGILLSDNIELISKLDDSASRFSDYFSVENPFSVSEAYEIKELIHEQDDNNKSHFMFCNTGTIGKFQPLWGTKKTRYLKDDYHKPVVDKDIFKEKFPKRFAQSTSPKILFKGMRFFDSFFDDKGDFIAGKSTIIAIPKSGTNANPYLGLLNSKLIKWLINELYNTQGIDGGINFTTGMISSLPMRNDISRLGQLAKLVTELTENPKNMELREKIDNVVYEMYGLNKKEIDLIEASL